ncbi:MAG TPA: hypothetical protein VF646_03670, partial [Cytophagales bacterium]
MKKMFLVLLSAVPLLLLAAFRRSDFQIPRTWDLEAIQRFHLPPPDPSVRVAYAPESYYDSLPEHVIYKTYPVYVREFETPGYPDSLRKREPQVAFDPAALKTPEDWVRAGELVFNWPAAFTPYSDKTPPPDTAMFRNGNGRYTREGIYPFSRYVITEKGKLLVGSLSCASCHTRVM